MRIASISDNDSGFKPYYNWNTFNTAQSNFSDDINLYSEVLNLIITGIPSIL